MNGGGSLRVATGFVALSVAESLREAARSAERDRWTLTQSGSSLVVNGFDTRFGLGMKPMLGGCKVDRAGMPLSSHHLRLSELAGGRPGSMDSYPFKSSSSVSSMFPLAMKSSIDDLRC